MHAPLDRPGRTKTDHDTSVRSVAGFLILPVVIAFVLVFLALKHPQSSIWISQAVDAEFGYGVPAATQMAEPAPLPQPTPVTGTIGSTPATFRK